jgi:hypothetical protein
MSFNMSHVTARPPGYCGVSISVARTKVSIRNRALSNTALAHGFHIFHHLGKVSWDIQGRQLSTMVKMGSSKLITT